MSYFNLREFLSLLYNIAPPSVNIANIFLIELFIVVLLSAINTEKFKKFVLCLLVLLQTELFLLAGILVAEEGWGAIGAFPFVIGLNFMAGVLGLLGWWRLRHIGYNLRWFKIVSILFLLVFPALIVQMILRPVFSPINQYLGHQRTPRQAAIDEKVWADEKEKAKKDYPELLREFETPQRVTAVNYDLKNEYQHSETGVIRIVSNNGSPKYLFLWRPISNELNADQIDQFNKYLETILNQEAVVELPTLDRFIGYYRENSLTLSIPTDSKYFYIPVQEVIVNNVRIYDKFCSMNICAQGFYNGY